MKFPASRVNGKIENMEYSQFKICRIMDKKQQRRKYKLHHNLRRKGNTVVAPERWVIKRAKEVSEIEKKWLAELLGFGYCVCDGLFTPPQF